MDERRNLPSASGFERLYECRGSWNLEKKLTDISSASPYAEMGNRIHAALEGTLAPASLDEDEFWVYERCAEYEQTVVAEIFSNDDAADLESSAEERLWLLDDDGNPLCSGKSDKRYIHRPTSHALIFDYKAGWNAVTDPASNAQLRVYAVLTALKYSVTKVTVAIIQPRCIPQYAICTYEESDLEYALAEIMQVLKEAVSDAAPRSAGAKQCNFCRAKSLCPEAKAFVVENISKAEDIVKLSRKEMKLREQLMPGESVADLLDKKKLIEKYIEAIDSEAKMRLKEERPVPGYGMVYGGGRRMVTDTFEMYNFLVNKKKWLSPRDAFRMMDFKIGEIVKLTTERVRVHKSISQDKLLANVYGALIEKKENEKRLERTSDTARKAKRGTKMIKPQSGMRSSGGTLESLFGRAR